MAAYAVARDQDFENPYGCAFADTSQRRQPGQHAPLEVDWTRSNMPDGCVIMITSMVVLNIINGFELTHVVVDGQRFCASGRWGCGFQTTVIIDAFLEHFSIRRF